MLVFTWGHRWRRLLRRLLSHSRRGCFLSWSLPSPVISSLVSICKHKARVVRVWCFIQHVLFYPHHLSFAAAHQQHHRPSSSQTRPRRYPLDPTSVHRTPGSPVTAATVPAVPVDRTAAAVAVAAVPSDPEASS